ncbi:hypothetical protein AVEN_253621-1 [Araneus ventricosus]|uniref:Uncharacterized protein n=1 Tax=Araneus ventricosus TaxID=182803 RepID=A0A4Y2CA38_ARAVE|nr:hypothetical protein AVEN_253621-1 [Araneus ventricosus]
MVRFRIRLEDSGFETPFLQRSIVPVGLVHVRSDVEFQTSSNCCSLEVGNCVAGWHIYKPYPDRTEAGNQSTSLATRSSDVVFSSRTKRTAIITEQESSYFSSPFSHS